MKIGKKHCFEGSVTVILMQNFEYRSLRLFLVTVCIKCYLYLSPTTKTVKLRQNSVNNCM